MKARKRKPAQLVENPERCPECYLPWEVYGCKEKDCHFDAEARKAELARGKLTTYPPRPDNRKKIKVNSRLALEKRLATQHGCIKIAEYTSSHLHAGEHGADMPAEGIRKRLEYWAPILTRKMEQEFHDTQKRLVNNPRFQERLSALRKEASADQNFAMMAHVRLLCNEWHLHSAEQWVARLIRDPEAWRWDTPLTQPRSGQRHWYPWQLEVCRLIDPKTNEKRVSSVNITLNSGVSSREIRQAGEAASKFLGDKEFRGNRPPLNDVERGMLRTVFMKLGFPKSRNRTDMIEKVKKEMDAHGHPLSSKVIGRELRAWLCEHGQPIKPYTTAKKDSCL